MAGPLCRRMPGNPVPPASGGDGGSSSRPGNSKLASGGRPGAGGRGASAAGMKAERSPSSPPRARAGAAARPLVAPGSRARWELPQVASPKPSLKDGGWAAPPEGEQTAKAGGLGSSGCRNSEGLRGLWKGPRFLLGPQAPGRR